MAVQPFWPQEAVASNRLGAGHRLLGTVNEILFVGRHAGILWISNRQADRPQRLWTDSSSGGLCDTVARETLAQPLYSQVKIFIFTRSSACHSFPEATRAPTKRIQ